MKIALTIAGSDSGGGAGIQADLKTFQAFGTFGTSVITAVTAQNTVGVNAVHAVPAPIVRAQIDALAADLPPAAFKTGMLATAELVELVAASIREHGFGNYVLDPVMVATSGDRLLDRDAEASIRSALLPLATLVTPNLDEAAILVRADVTDEAAMVRAGEALLEAGAKAALIKGGHLKAGEIVDVLVDGRGVERWRRERIDTRSTHGTGCTLSAAVAQALAYVHRAIAAAPGLGRGHGPLNHSVSR